MIYYILYSLTFLPFLENNDKYAIFLSLFIWNILYMCFQSFYFLHKDCFEIIFKNPDKHLSRCFLIMYIIDIFCCVIHLIPCIFSYLEYSRVIKLEIYVSYLFVLLSLLLNIIKLVIFPYYNFSVSFLDYILLFSGFIMIFFVTDIKNLNFNQQPDNEFQSENTQPRVIKSRKVDIKKFPRAPTKLNISVNSV